MVCVAILRLLHAVVNGRVTPVFQEDTWNKVEEVTTWLVYNLGGQYFCAATRRRSTPRRAAQEDCIRTNDSVCEDMANSSQLNKRSRTLATTPQGVVIRVDSAQLDWIVQKDPHYAIIPAGSDEEVKMVEVQSLRGLRSDSDEDSGRGVADVPPGPLVTGHR